MYHTFSWFKLKVVEIIIENKQIIVDTIDNPEEVTKKIGSVEYHEENCYLRSGTNYLIT